MAWASDAECTLTVSARREKPQTPAQAGVASVCFLRDSAVIARSYLHTSEWLGALDSPTWGLIRPLLGMVEWLWRGNPEERGYAARSVSLAMGETADEADNVGFAACVCNIGMVGVPDASWNRAGSLSLDERRDVERHPWLGAMWLEGWKQLDPVMARIAVTVRHHHERWDGQGYPDGLRGDDTPTGARVVSVVEAFHAMVSPRPYRDAMPVEVAAERLLSNASTQFDPQAVDTFLTFLQSQRT